MKACETQFDASGNPSLTASLLDKWAWTNSLLRPVSWRQLFLSPLPLLTRLRLSSCARPSPNFWRPSLMAIVTFPTSFGAKIKRFFVILPAFEVLGFFHSAYRWSCLRAPLRHWVGERKQLFKPFALDCLFKSIAHLNGFEPNSRTRYPCGARKELLQYKGMNQCIAYMGHVNACFCPYFQPKTSAMGFLQISCGCWNWYPSKEHIGYCSCMGIMTSKNKSSHVEPSGRLNGVMKGAVTIEVRSLSQHLVRMKIFGEGADK